MWTVKQLLASVRATQWSLPIVRSELRALSFSAMNPAACKSLMIDNGPEKVCVKSSS